MTLRIRQYLTLTGLTAREATRQPITLLLTTACVVLTGLVPMLALYTFGEDGKLVRDGGLAFHLIFGILVTGSAACASLAREVRSGTASAVLSKPVGRELFFAAKFSGILLVVVAFSLCATLATLLSERAAERFTYSPRVIGYVTDWQTAWLLVAVPVAAFVVAGAVNFLARRPFESSAFGLLTAFMLLVFLICGCFDRLGHFAPFHPHVEWRILPASVLLMLALCIFGALALSLSVRLKTAAVLTVCFIVLVIGLACDVLAGGLGAGSVLGGLVFGLLPNWQHFWVADALNAGGRIPWAYVGQTGVYAGAYAAGVLGIGLVCFRHAEMK